MKRFAALFALIALLAVPGVALAQFNFAAELTVEDEVPAPTVPDGYAGEGNAVIMIHDDETSMTYDVHFSGLTGPLAAAHIHWGAPGEAGPPIFGLTGTGTTSPLTGTLTEADFMPAAGGPQTVAEAIAEIRAGNAYVNLHTEANEEGELRGQLGEVEIDFPPPTSTDQPASGLLPWTVVLAALGLGGVLLVTRRFLTRLG